MIKLLNDKKHIAVIFLIALIWSVILPVATSPLYGFGTIDSGMFITIGRAMTRGLVPYVDMFDHKGVVIFILNAIPQLIVPGTVGVWAFELVYLFIALIFLFKTANLLISKGMSIVIVMLFVLGFVLHAGNMTEGYSTYLTMPVIYLYMKYYTGDSDDINPVYGLIIGVLTALVLNINVINAAVLLGITMGASIHLLIMKNYRNLFKNMLMFLLGFILCLAPIMIWLYDIDALSSMIDTYILHNLKYIDSGSALIGNILSFEFNLLFSKIAFLIVLAVSIFSLVKKERVHGLVLLCSGLTTFLAVNLSPFTYRHYTVMFVLPVAFAFLIFFYLIGKKREIKKHVALMIGIVVLLLFVMWSIPQTNRRLSSSGDIFREYKSDTIEMGELIPDNDREEVFGYNVESYWYQYNDISPCIKYFTLQNRMAETNPVINDEILTEIKDIRPKWIILVEYPENDKRINSYIYDNYSFVFENTSGKLYKLN